MSKYAIFIPCSANYLPGLNALLNGLDKYGNTADVWVIEQGIPEDYKKEAQKVFNFSVNFIPLLDICKRKTKQEEDLFSHLDLNRFSSFYRWAFAAYIMHLQLKGKYKAVAHIGADNPVINNIMKWFEIAEKTGLIVVADNPYHLSTFNEVDERHFYKDGPHKGLICSSPVADCPAFMDPTLHEDVIKETLRMSLVTDANMEAFNTAIYNTKKADKLLILNSQLWTCGVYYMFKMSRSMGAENRMLYFANRERVHAIHKQYWNDSTIYQAIYDKVPGTWLYEFAYNNLWIWCNIYRELNTKWKLKYDYPKNTVFDRLKTGELKLRCEKAKEIKE